MTSAFDAAIAALFADPHLGKNAIYTAAGVQPIPVRIMARRADDVSPKIMAAG